MLKNNLKVVTNIYGIMINGIRVTDFNIFNRNWVIKHIKASNIDIKYL